MKTRFLRPWALWAATAASAGAALLMFALVDAAYGLPSLFYVPLIFASLAGGRRAAIIAAPALTAAYVAALIVGTNASVAEIATVGAIRLAVSLLIGLLIGSNVDYTRELVRAAVGRANRDFLTGLGTRHTLDERWEENRRRAKPFGVVMIDMDELKEINDHAGHAAGDAALKSLAASIRRGVRSHDVMARIGGDEFVVIADLHDPAELETLADRIQRDARSRDVEASFGTAMYPEDGYDLTSVLEIADRRMYDEKLAKQARTPTFSVVRAS